MTTESFEFETSETVGGGGSYLDTPGTYHFAVDEFLKDVHAGSGKIIDGGGVSVTLIAMAGTTKDQDDKKHNETFFNPKLSSKDQGAFAKRKMTALFLALGIIKPDDLGKKMKIEFDPESMRGKQLIMTVEKNAKDSTETRTFVQLSFDSVFHVDDPRAKNFPKNEGALKLLSDDSRKPESYFAPLQSKAEKKIESASKATADILDEI